MGPRHVALRAPLSQASLSALAKEKNIPFGEALMLVQLLVAVGVFVALTWLYRRFHRFPFLEPIDPLVAEP